MIFRQLFEPDSSTYTYLIGCPDSRDALLVDPVLETFERDLDAVRSLGLRLAWTLETHIHADHLTSALKLKSLVDCRIAAPALDGLGCADLGVAEDSPLTVGSVTLQPLFTPGHTDAHHAYLIESRDGGRVLTGDALLIDGCGRTDFQGGDARTLYRSVHDRLFALPDDTLVFPGHDYQGRRISTVAQERQRNPRLGGGRSLEDFVALMDDLGLPYPKKMDLAVPANQACGRCPDTVPADMQKLCEVSIQG